MVEMSWRVLVGAFKKKTGQQRRPVFFFIDDTPCCAPASSRISHRQLRCLRRLHNRWHRCSATRLSHFEQALLFWQ